MNILEAEDIIKGLPDDALMQESEMPTGQLPQFLVVSEIQRRSDMRNRYAQQMREQPQGTVADQIKQQGIMSMMPQMGMPQMGMPPQMMSAGGIVKLANGGSTSMPGAGALMGFQVEQIDPLLERAKMEARRLGISIEEAYEALKRQAEMNMPNYSMIAPAGMGDIPSLSDIDSAVSSAAQSMYGMIPQSSPDGGAVGRAISSAQGFIDDFPYQSALQMPNYRALLGPVVSGAGITDRLGEISDELGITGVDLDAKRRARIEANLAERPLTRRTPRAPAPLDEAQMSLAEAQIDALDGPSAVPVDRSFQGITLSETKPKPRVRPASEIYKDSFITQGIDSLGRGIDAVGGFLSDAVRGANMPSRARPSMDFGGIFDGEGTEPNAVASAVDALSKEGTGVDQSSPEVATTSEQSGGANVQGAGTEVQGRGREAQSTSKYGAFDDLLAELTGGDGTTDEGLDISDLLADQRRMTQANMLMQLGAGIAGGDVSKGLSAAGMAGMKGAEAEQSLALKERLAKYQAGRQDLKRTGDVKLAIAKMNAELERSDDVTKRSIINYYSDLATELRKKATALAPLGETLNADEQALLAAISEMVSTYSGQFGLGLPKITPPPSSGAPEGWAVKRP